MASDPYEQELQELTEEAIGTVRMGDPSPETLEQDADEIIPDGFFRPYLGAALVPEPKGALPMPAGTPVCGPTDGPFVANVAPRNGQPLTSAQAAWLNARFPGA